MKALKGKDEEMRLNHTEIMWLSMDDTSIVTCHILKPLGKSVYIDIFQLR